ncbi:MAG: hypothetical protein WAT79_15815, partial [Saprospiraceae bacterium]
IFRTGQRMGRIDKTFACLIIILMIGIFQDKIFSYLDRKFFPYKYQMKATYEGKDLKRISELDIIVDFVITVLTWVFIGLYVILVVNEFYPLFSSVLGNTKPLSYLFGDAQWTIHVIFFLVLGYQLLYFFNKRK